jgi:glycyl-tRNA synthetase beta chain
LAEWIAREALGLDAATAAQAATAARLAKADLTSDMVREFTELQGTIGGIYAREDGQPEEVWKAIYYHYLPVGVEPDAPPTKAQLGKAAVTWAAVSLADKLDTIVGLFSAGEKPTGSRDPYGLRRAAQGVVKILVDLPELAPRADLALFDALHRAFEPFVGAHGGVTDAWRQLGIMDFMWERLAHLLERRGYQPEEIRVVRTVEDASVQSYPSEAMKRVAALAKNKTSPDFRGMAFLFKRVKNITKGLDDSGTDLAEVKTALKEPAEVALIDQLIVRWPEIETAIYAGRSSEAIGILSHFREPVDRFFTDVMVMSEDPTLRQARLAILLRLRSAILKFFGDISQIVPDEEKALV